MSMPRRSTSTPTSKSTRSCTQTRPKSFSDQCKSFYIRIEPLRLSASSCFLSSQRKTPACDAMRTQGNEVWVGAELHVAVDIAVTESTPDESLSVWATEPNFVNEAVALTQDARNNSTWHHRFFVYGMRDRWIARRRACIFRREFVRAPYIHTFVPRC